MSGGKSCLVVSVVAVLTCYLSWLATDEGTFFHAFYDENIYCISNYI